MQGFMAMHVNINVNDTNYHVCLAGPNASVDDGPEMPIGALPQPILDALLDKGCIKPA